MDGSVVFREIGDVYRSLELPCGQCLFCRLQRARHWAMRCMHEARMHKASSFITLTYAEDRLPENGSLYYPHFQRFMRNLRRRDGVGNVRFYMCGEYGELLSRPHYHACIFGERFDDRVFWDTTGSGEKIYRSALLDSLWPYGFASVGDVTFESAAYIARYCVAKVTGDRAIEHYGKKVPEFNRMSLKPGIGASWFDKFAGDVYPHDSVIVQGKEVKPPKFYDKLFEAQCPDAFETLKWERQQAGMACLDDNTPRRLKDKETVAAARLAFYKRTMVHGY